MATDPKTIININQDPSYGPQDTAFFPRPEQPIEQTITIQYTNPPLYGTPELQIINAPGGNSNGEVQYNKSNRFGADTNFRWDSKNRTLNILGNLRLTGDIQGKIVTSTAKFKLYGGNENYVLSTDGQGNVTWVDIESVSYGNSNVANYLITYNGNLRGSNLNITDTAYLYNISSTGTTNLTNLNIVPTGTANLGPVSNVIITGGNSGQLLTTDGNGSLSWTTYTTGVNVSDEAPVITSEGQQWFNSVDGRTYVSYQNTWVDASPVVTPDPDISANTITFPDGSVQTTAFNGITISNTQPELGRGNVWFDEDEGRAYINYDGTSWVDLSPAITPDPDYIANTITFFDGTTQNTAWPGTIWTTVPSSNTSPGIPGQLAYDNGTLYVCVGANVWGQTQLNLNW